VLASGLALGVALATARARAEEPAEATPAPSAPPALPTETPPAEAPQSIDVVGERPAHGASESTRARPEIEAAPHRTGGDLLQIVPGVFITQHSGQGKAYQIFYRGFDAVHGQDVELWVGGAPVNEVSNVHGQGYADLHFVMPEVVREVRATPGTYDPRQGDFAVAGSIRYELGYAEPGVTAKLGVGSFGERRVFLAWHPEGSDERSFAAFEAQETDGFGPARAARRTSAIAQHVIALGDATSLRLLTQAYAARFDSAGVLPSSYVEAAPSSSARRFDALDPNQGGYSARASLVAAITRAPGDGSELELAPFLVWRSLKLRQDYTGYLQHPSDGDSTQQLDEAVTIGATARYKRRVALFRKDDSVEAGLSLRSDWIDQSQRSLSIVGDRVLSTPVLAKVRATDAAGWIDVAARPLSRLTIRAGVRIDGLAYATEDDAPAAGTSTRVGSDGAVSDPRATGQARAAMGSVIDPRASVDARVWRGLHVVASYGRGLRSPQARSLGDGERTPFTRVDSAELGLRYAETPWLRGSLSAFRTSLSDDLVFDPVTTRNERVPSTARTGVALEYVMRPAAWFVSAGSATYTHAAFTKSDATYHVGDLLPYVPQLVIRQDLAFTPSLGRLGPLGEARARIGAALTGLVNRPLPYGERGSDVFLVDASAAVRAGHFELGLDVFNALDAMWFDGEFSFASALPGARASLVPQRHVSVGAPRTVMATFAAYL
jgi:hypothetical protein